jgi:hypothetical protein
LPFRKECSEPVKILSTFRKKFLRGRPLNLSSEVESIVEGATTEIFVSRESLLKDTVDELLRGDIDLSYPLEVSFIGELAADLGGPRREYLHAVIRDMMDELFEEVDGGGFVIGEDPSGLYIHERRYYVAGLLVGK